VIRLLLRVLLAAASIVFVVAPQAASAQTDVGCTTAALISAIDAANATPATTDTLSLSSGCVYSFTSADLTNGDSALPRITTSITIQGSGAVIERSSGAAADFRLLYIAVAGRWRWTISRCAAGGRTTAPASTTTSAGR
jgi:hypothetical protein